MYYIVEIQKAVAGNESYLVNTAETRNQAESIYHQILAYAANSNLPLHSAIIFTDEGFPIMYQCYKHDPIPEETAE